MLHRGRHRWRRVDGGHERANLGANSRQGDGKPRLEDATGYVAMAGQGNVRGPPGPKYGAGPMWSIGPAITVRICSNDRDVH